MGRRARLATIGSAIALAAAIAGCPSDHRSGAPASDRSQEAPGAEDPRYRLTLEVGEDAAGAWAEVVVEPAPGWHLAAEAPARFVVEDPNGGPAGPSPHARAGVRVRPEQLVARAPLPRLAGPQSRPPTVQGHLRFGICRSPAGHCSIVRRQVPVRLPQSGAAGR